MAAMQRLGHGDTEFPVRVTHWPPKKQLCDKLAYGGEEEE